MALNISERNQVGEYYGNAISNIGAEFANVFTKQQEERKKIKQADSATKSYLKAMASFGMVPEDKVKGLIEGDPSKPLTDNVFARQNFIEAFNANNAFQKQQKENAYMDAQIAAMNRKGDPKPIPGAQGYRKTDLEGGQYIYRDEATGEALPSSAIQGGASDKPGRGKIGTVQEVAPGVNAVWTSESGIQVLDPSGHARVPTRVEEAKWAASRKKAAKAGDADAWEEYQSYFSAMNNGAPDDTVPMPEKTDTAGVPIRTKPSQPIPFTIKPLTKK